ncbi:ATP-dependent zinc metalloprotease FtsH [Pseudoteredinibacter isoporae]|nr:ATP-dependent zinc metalloprotease FtsH [Pseudoteredinibacter isoporae]NHO86769.1 ATP-dependent zinc metalloprotease FtsH [Pseudoteredinibacter isoporae]NIB24779.1 ATP-dependent zinc metalloprotease FtsH [Pseudoteredinibacter isoporae]
MSKNLVLWLVIAAVLFAVFQNINGQTKQKPLVYSDFIAEVRSGQVQKVVVDGLIIHGERRDGSTFQVVRPQVADNKLMDDLYNHKVQVEGKLPEKPSIWQQLLVASFPILIILVIFMFFMRQMQGGAGGRGGPMSFGKSKARLLGEDQVKTTFADVAGVDEAKEEVQELVEYLRDPSKFQRLGGQIPRGVLMAGPPGTGKTLLAKAIAGEAKVPFFSISGSDFVEMFVGVGASRVRDMFDQAKKQAPCIIFIDEIDAVGRHRGGGHGGGHDEREQTLNQLLVEMDGFEGNEGVIVMAATNRADVLDKALMRPGRFDRQVHVGLPDIRGREQILKVHMRKVPMDDAVKASVIARGTPGFSGADLMNLVNEAALFAARANKRTVSMEDFEKARDKIMMGAERKSMVMSEDDKIMTAYHEAGHAIVGYLMPEHDPVHKVTIIPRGGALGVTQFLPEDDKYSHSRRYLLGQISTLYGGRIAEEMTGGADAVSTGASSDIDRATKIARGMVMKWGLSEKLGPLAYGEDEGQYPGMSSPNYSGATSKVIDEEVRSIIDDRYKVAEGILEENRDILESMKDALIEYETIDSEQVEDLMNRRQVRPPRDWDDSDFNSHIKTEKKDKPDSDKSTGPIGGPANES